MSNTKPQELAENGAGTKIAIRVELIGLVVGLALQGGVAIWWAGHTDQRVTDLESGQKAAGYDKSVLNRVDQRVTDLAETVHEIKDQLTQEQAQRRR